MYIYYCCCFFSNKINRKFPLVSISSLLGCLFLLNMRTSHLTAAATAAMSAPTDPFYNIFCCPFFCSSFMRFVILIHFIVRTKAKDIVHCIRKCGKNELVGKISKNLQFIGRNRNENNKKSPKLYEEKNRRKTDRKNERRKSNPQMKHSEMETTT